MNCSIPNTLRVNYWVSRIYSSGTLTKFWKLDLLMFSKAHTELTLLEIPVPTTGTDLVSRTLYSVQNRRHGTGSQNRVMRSVIYLHRNPLEWIYGTKLWSLESSKLVTQLLEYGWIVYVQVIYLVSVIVLFAEVWFILVTVNIWVGFLFFWHMMPQYLVAGTQWWCIIPEECKPQLYLYRNLKTGNLILALGLIILLKHSTCEQYNINNYKVMIL